MTDVARAKAAVLRELRQTLLADEKRHHDARVESHDEYRELTIERAALAQYTSEQREAGPTAEGDEELRARRAAFEEKEEQHLERERRLAADERRLAERQLELEEKERRSLEQWQEQVDGLEQQQRQVERRSEDVDRQVDIVRQEGIKAKNLLKAQIQLLEKYGITPERRYLNEILKKIRRLVEARPHKPKVFISYAWYSQGSKELESLQRRLYQLRRDLLTVGVDRVFFDEANMTGNLKNCMREGMAESDIVLLIGTPRLKERAEEQQENGKPANNLQFELEQIAKRCRDDKNFLMPVLFDGQIGFSFPMQICCEGFALAIFDNLIRAVDCKSDRAYGLTLVGTRPLGIIPAIFGFSDTDEQYQDCLDKVWNGVWGKAVAGLRVVSTVAFTPVHLS
jgi:hypothetical protein